MKDGGGKFHSSAGLEMSQRALQRQELHMTMELVQAIRILQMNRLELKEYVQEQLNENPVLEEAESESDETAVPGSVEVLREKIEDAARDTYDDQDGWEPQYERAGSSGIEDFEKFVRSEISAREYLLEQIGMMQISRILEKECDGLIGEMDENGYLPSDIESSKEALSLVQSLDPPGTGARSLQECLELQLADMDGLTDVRKTIIEELLEDAAANRIPKIAKMLGISRDRAQEEVSLIRHLDPRPLSRFFDAEPEGYVVPDLIVEYGQGGFEVRMNRAGVPGIRISPYYRGLAEEQSGDPELQRYLNGKFKDAGQLISSILQRRKTMLRVGSAIVYHQPEAALHGASMLKPLTEKEIAEELGIHVSTVSRAVDGKYMQCPCGIMAMRQFFSGGTEELSAKGIQARIKKLIEDENPEKPLSDQKIADMLEADHIHIARRTVMKYREKLGIEAASRRKRFGGKQNG
ncbi:MAG: RNA polymerase factor sigma-54, partial [Eubacterium sp.]